jgi:hypothetical protein
LYGFSHLDSYQQNVDILYGYGEVYRTGGNQPKGSRGRYRLYDLLPLNKPLMRKVSSMAL